MAGSGTPIRPVRLSDAPEIARLASVLGYPAEPQGMRAYLAPLLADARHRLLAADAGDGVLLGWLHVEHRIAPIGGEWAEITGLVVDPAARRRGLARALLAAGEGWARTRGLGTVSVRSNAARAEAHPFYRSLGFGYVKTQHVYRRPLAPAPAEEDDS